MKTRTTVAVLGSALMAAVVATADGCSSGKTGGSPDAGPTDGRADVGGPATGGHHGSSGSSGASGSAGAAGSGARGSSGSHGSGGSAGGACNFKPWNTTNSICDVNSAPCDGGTCYANAHVGTYDFPATCSFMGPPTYATKQIYHSAGFQVQPTGTWLGESRTFTWPDEVLGAVEFGLGVGYPLPAPCTGLPGITCTLTTGTTVTVSAISPGSVSGSYTLVGNCDDGSKQTFSGDFSSSVNCPGF